MKDTRSPRDYEALCSALARRGTVKFKILWEVKKLCTHKSDRARLSLDHPLLSNTTVSCVQDALFIQLNCPKG